MNPDLNAIRAALPDALDAYFHDAERMTWLLAGVETARLIDAEMHSAQVFKGRAPTARFDPEGRLALLSHSLDQALQANMGPDALICEFGVHQGESVTHLGKALAAKREPASPTGARPPTEVHGFDSFEGLPDDWFLGRKAGRFSLQGALPNVPSNVRLHKGWFSDTLPGFLESHRGPAALLHLDADLYSSTKTVLDAFTQTGRIRPGTMLVFDEFFNYPGWKEHEYKAFKEWVETHRVRFEYTGMAPCHYSAAVRVESMG